MKKLSEGFWEITLNVTGVKVGYTCQTVEDRMYLYVDKRGPFALFGDDMFSELKKLVDSMKHHEGLRVILAGRLPAVCQLRPDLEEFYFGLPDDYRVKGLYGIDIPNKPVRIKLGKVDFDMVSLLETSMRKSASIMQLRGGKFGPAPGREPDVVDSYLITLSMFGEEMARAWAKANYDFGDLTKTKFPDLYARMRAAGLLAGVE